MKTPKSLLQKFKINKYNLISLPSIQLSPEEADRFLDYVFDESAMKQYARIERMNVPEKPIRQIGFGAGQFLYPAGRFNESKYKKQWADQKILLQTKKLRGAVAIYDDDLEDLPPTMSEDAFKNQIMTMIAKKISHELELAYWMGDTASLNWGIDEIGSVFNGWRYRVTHSASGETYYNSVTGGAHLLDACDGGTTGNIFQIAGAISEREATAPYDWEHKYSGILRTMPSKYKSAEGLKNMAFLNSDQITQDYITALSSRSTGLGDAVLKGEANPQYGRVGIIDVPLMPTDLGSPCASPSTDGVIGGGVYADCLLTPRGNLVIGMQRDIRIESQRVAADEATYVFYSIRSDVAVENVDAVVLCRGLTHNV